MSNRVSIYLEQEILSANGLQLVHIAYQEAINELRDARRNMAAKKIREKCSNLSRASALIGELLCSLDMDAGGEIAIRLKALYEYILGRILEANLKNLDEPLAQVISLLSTLDEGWKELANQRTPEASASRLAAQFGGGDIDAPAQVWSF